MDTSSNPVCRYKFTMPTQGEATELGIRYEGLETRIRFWLQGVAFIVSLKTGVSILLRFETSKTFIIETNAPEIIEVISFLSEYGYKCDQFVRHLNKYVSFSLTPSIF